MPQKPKPIVDEEESQKQTVRDSPLGKMLMSDKKCPECGTPHLDNWHTCVKCNRDLTKKEEPKKEEPPKEEPPKEKYVCSKCGEPVEVNSEKCAKCGHDRAKKIQ